MKPSRKQAILKFTRRFELNYGQGAIFQFKRLIRDPSCTLSNIAKCFGFSRANASLVYQKIYGSPFSQEKRMRALAKNLRKLQETPRYRLAIKSSEFLRKNGFEPEIEVKDQKHIYLKCNGYRITPRKPYQSRVGSYKYFRLDLDLESDFSFITLPSSDVYIIPSRGLGLNQNRISIPPIDHESKYHQFRNAFESLRN